MLALIWATCFCVTLVALLNRRNKLVKAESEIEKLNQKLVLSERRRESAITSMIRHNKEVVEHQEQLRELQRKEYEARLAEAEDLK